MILKNGVLLGSTWFEIGRGIAMAHDHAPEDIKVIGAQKVVDNNWTGCSCSYCYHGKQHYFICIKSGWSNIDHYKKAKEIKCLKLNDKKLEADLEKEAEKGKKEALENITKEISVTLKLDKNGEKFKALEKSVKNLIDFVENDGEVNLFTDQQETDEENPEIERLKVNFSEIK